LPRGRAPALFELQKRSARRNQVVFPDDFFSLSGETYGDSAGGDALLSAQTTTRAGWDGGSAGGKKEGER